MTTLDPGPAPAETPTAPALAPATAAVRRRPSRRSVLVGTGLLAVVGVGAASTAYSLSGSDHGGGGVRAAMQSVGVSAPVVMPVAAISGLRSDGAVRWQDPLTVAVRGGTLTGVSGTGPNGAAVDGALGADGRWLSTTGLFPASTYRLVASVRDTGGTTRRLPLSATTTPAEKTFSVTVAPGDGALVGVGQAVSVRLSTPVKDAAARAEVEQRLSVTTVPAVVGAWRWMSSSELRYRGADLWPADTTITVTAALDHLQAVPGVWGTGTRTSTFTVGDALTSVVDTKAHTMTVSKNGEVVRVMKASMGKPQFATRDGTFVVLEKFADRVMDSATVDLPPGTPPYKTAVKDAVRITNSGTFTHGAPWSVESQGVANVSHGCINLSPTDAHWYFLQVRRGDVVTVVNSTEGPNLSDAGSRDWNMSFEKWKSGSALA